MSNLTAKLKGMNYKDLLVNHVEKLVVGVVGLLVLGCVFGARWAGIEKNPGDLEKDVAKTRQEIRATKWPDAEKQTFVNSDDIQKRAKKMMAPLDGARFQYNNEVFWSVYRKQEPVEEPDLMTVENMIADSGRVILALRPEGADSGELGADEPGPGPDGPEQPGGTGTQGKQDTAPDDKVDPDLTLGRGTRTGRGAGGVRGAADPAARDELEMQHAPGTQEEMAADGMETGTGMSRYGAASQNGRGARYVAVRAVFPLQSQIKKVANALHELDANVANLVDILNFELQRQTAVDGPDPWIGEWEKVSEDVALDILNQVEAFDPDVVDSGIISDVMTMPIPSRIVGLPDSRATHPRVENFELSQEEKQRLAKLNERIIEKFKEQEAEQPQRAERGGFAPSQHNRGGFAPSQHNIRGMTRQVLSGAGGMDFMTQFNKELDAEKLKKILDEDFRNRANAIGRLLLFRYFDFDVEPGNVYRYRVRLSLLNPNFDRPVEELLTPDSAKRLTRLTEWSEPTAPVTVERDVEYYLSKIKTPFNKPDMSTALIDVFQWDPDAGTTVNKQLETDFGQMIGGKAETPVLNPAKQTFEEEEYEFKTGDVLVDMQDGPLIKDDMHSDLILTKEMQGKLGTSLGISDQVLMVNKYGEVVTMDDVSDQAAHGLKTRQIEAWHQHYAHLKKKAAPQPGADGLDAYAAEMGMYGPAEDGSSDMMYGPPTGPQPRNPLDKRGRTGKRSRRAPPGSYPQPMP